MLILKENKVSKTQLNSKIQKKVLEKLGINCDFSMYYGYYLDLNLEFTKKEFDIVAFYQSKIKLVINNYCCLFPIYNSS